LADFFLGALATLVGALAAFGLEAWRRKRDERRSQAERFKTALFILILQRTFLRTLHSQQLDPKRDHPIRAYAIHTILGTPPLETLNAQALAFLLSTGEAELLNRLTAAEAKYRTLVAIVEDRNAAHLNFQEKLQAAQQATQVSEGTLDDLRRIAGPVIGSRLEQLTDELYDVAEDAIQFNRDVYVSAVQSYRRLFPGASMFGVEDLPLAEISNDARDVE
jgi:hypothetical protein